MIKKSDDDADSPTPSKKKRTKRKPRKVKAPGEDKLTLPTIRENVQTGRVGRPTTLTSEMLKAIETICLTQPNPTYSVMYKTLEVPKPTFHRWLDTYADLRERIDKWREQGLQRFRVRLGLRAATDDRMLRYLLDRRDPMFKRGASGLDESDVEDVIDGDALPPLDLL